jgi:hypothetical protein
MEPRGKTVHGDEDRVPMWCFAYVQLGATLDTPSEFSLRGTSAPAWSQVKKHDDRPSSRSTRKAAGSSGASNN